VSARKYSKENRDRLVSMTDDELLAYERQRHGNPYMTLGTAKELRKTAPKFWHLGAARERAEELAALRIRRSAAVRLSSGTAGNHDCSKEGSRAVQPLNQRREHLRLRLHSNVHALAHRPTQAVETVIEWDPLGEPIDGQVLGL
jgi:hypothetical protein